MACRRRAAAEGLASAPERRPRLEDRRQPDGRPLRRPGRRNRARLDGRFFTVLVVAVVTSPGWPEVKEAFFNREVFRESFPDIASAFLTNVKIFCIAEVVILFTALGLAVVRILPGPVFFPLRLLAIVYSDVFRGIPTILLIYLFGFGIPALGLAYVSEPELLWGVPAEMVWGTVALILVYTAYVSEVYRAGIESVHSSQNAAARSLGLSHGQSLRYVVVPQAVRRVIPPLLNDFIGLQKDTALVALIGVVEAFRVADRVVRDVQLHAVPRDGADVPPDHDPPHAAHRLPDRARPQTPPDGRGRDMSALRLEDVHKSFGKVDVLRGIDLEVAEHDVVCLIGASGSGKSTLLRCVNLLEPVDSGRIFVDGNEITARGVDVNTVRRGIGIVFQAFNLFPHMSVLDNVTLGPRKALGESRPRRRSAPWSSSRASASPTRPPSTPTGSPAASSSARRSYGLSR